MQPTLPCKPNLFKSGCLFSSIHQLPFLTSLVPPLTLLRYQLVLHLTNSLTYLSIGLLVLVQLGKSNLKTFYYLYIRSVILARTNTFDSSMAKVVDNKGREFERSIDGQTAKGLSEGKVDLFLQ